MKLSNVFNVTFSPISRLLQFIAKLKSICADIGTATVLTQSYLM